MSYNKLMELFQLRYFLEVARQQHVRRSAEALHVSQPAVTNAIHRLESEIGVPLFVPSGRSIQLSPYGKALYNEILPLYESLDSLPDKIKKLEPRESVTIRMNVYAAWFIVMETILEFQRIDPNVCFKVTRSESQELSDITVFTTQHYRPRKRKADNLFVCSEEVYLAVPDVPRFRKKDSIRLDEVTDLGFIQISDKLYFRTICDSFCKAAGVHPNTAFESDDPSTVRAMICSNVGVGFWPEFALGKMFTERILLKRIEEPRCMRDIVVEKHALSRDNIHVQVFYDYLTRTIDHYRRQNAVNQG